MRETRIRHSINGSSIVEEYDNGILLNVTYFSRNSDGTISKHDFFSDTEFVTDSDTDSDINIVREIVTKKSLAEQEAVKNNYLKYLNELDKLK